MNGKKTKIPTILTLPTVSTIEGFYYRLRSEFSWLKKIQIHKYSAHLFECDRYIPRGGHYGRNKALYDGLSRLNIDFQWNPIISSKISENVCVLSGVSTLKQAINLKEKGKIKRLIAGPNIVQNPEDFCDLIGNSYIDNYLVPSQWTKDYYETYCDKLSGRCVIWPAGIDVDYWNCSLKDKNENLFLIYKKNCDYKIAESIEKFFLRKKIKTISIEYGRYKKIDYFNALKKSHFAVFLSPSESFGIALVEAWSMHVPTFVWEPGLLKTNGLELKNSSAPFLSEDSGLKFKNYSEFLDKFNFFMKKKYQPRKWAVENFSSVDCALNFMKIMDGTC